jgi:hypothetical protein
MAHPEIAGRDLAELKTTAPLVASVADTMAALKNGRAKTYELINSGELESYLDGSSRKVLWSSIHAYIRRRLADESARRDGVVTSAKRRNR